MLDRVRPCRPAPRIASAAGNSASVSQSGRGWCCSPASVAVFRCAAASAVSPRTVEELAEPVVPELVVVLARERDPPLGDRLVEHVPLVVHLREPRVRLVERRLERERVAQVALALRR